MIMDGRERSMHALVDFEEKEGPLFQLIENSNFTTFEFSKSFQISKTREIKDRY